MGAVAERPVLVFEAARVFMEGEKNTLDEVENDVKIYDMVNH